MYAVILKLVNQIFVWFHFSNKEDVRKTKSFQKVAQAHANVFVDLYLSQ